MPELYRLTRTISVRECPWLGHSLPAGALLWSWEGLTYGSVSRDGKAMSRQQATFPFFEVPWDALEKVAE